MKKTKINLIISREDYQKYERYFSYFRIGLIVLVVIFISISLFLLVSVKNKADQRNLLILEKDTLLKKMQSETIDQAKINYIENKYQDLTTFLKDDANSSPYYSLLNSALQQNGTQSAALKSFTIDKDRNVTFTIAFSDFSQLRNYFQYIETPSFLGNFETISLKSFSVIGATDIQKENYQLSFVGKFTTLKHN
ncbi:hypothetical protein M1328_02970 [Patescibacteria group bacterium]|nr:hypothetical protein [Patescibacteria group bacterium]